MLAVITIIRRFMTYGQGTNLILVELKI